MAGHRRHRQSAFPWARVFAIVIGIHLGIGGGLFWLARTQSGQDFAKVYDIKLFQPEKPPEPETPKVEEPPPPIEKPLEAPPVATAAVAAPAPAAAAPAVGGSAVGGLNWGGGRFVGGFEDGPLGAFHASVTSRFRDAYREPAKSEQFGPAKVELTVDANGGVRSYRLAQSSGSSVNDEALLAAAEVVKQKGVGTPPDSKARVVSVNFVPY